MKFAASKNKYLKANLFIICFSATSVLLNIVIIMINMEFSSCITNRIIILTNSFFACIASTELLYQLYQRQYINNIEENIIVHIFRDKLQLINCCDDKENIIEANWESIKFIQVVEFYMLLIFRIFETSEKFIQIVFDKNYVESLMLDDKIKQESNYEQDQNETRIWIKYNEETIKEIKKYYSIGNKG